MNAPDTSQTNGEFILSTHAQERSLERTGLSAGYVQELLQRGAVVWLPRPGGAGDWHGLIFSASADAFFVAVVATDAPVVKTVLTLAQWEKNFHRLRPVWPALARMAAAQSFARAARVPDPGDFTLEVLLLHRRSEEASTPCNRTAVSLGALSRQELTSRGFVAEELQVRSAGHGLTVALALLKRADFANWVLEQVRPHTRLLDDNTELLLRAHQRHVARYADITSALVRYLGGTPALHGGAVQCLGEGALTGLNILRARPVGACELPP